MTTMKTIFYSFSKDATNSQKANLGKLIRIREKKGKLKRVRRGNITVNDEFYDEVVDLIKRYNGIIDNPSKLSDLSDDTLVNELLNNIEQIKEKLSKLELIIANLNLAKATQKKKNNQISKRLDILEKELAKGSNALTELKKNIKKKMPSIINTDLETVVQSLQEITNDIVGRLDDLDARLNALEELAGGEVHYL